MPQLRLALRPEEAVGQLEELIQADVRVERLQDQLDSVNLRRKTLKADLDAAIEQRTHLSHQIREQAEQVEELAEDRETEEDLDDEAHWPEPDAADPPPSSVSFSTIRGGERTG